MSLKYLIKDLENLKGDLDNWIKELEALEEKDIKKFFKKGIKAPSIRIRSKLISIMDQCAGYRKLILLHRKEMEVMKESPLSVNYKKSRRKNSA